MMADVLWTANRLPEAERHLRRAIELRHSRPEFSGAVIEWLESPADGLTFRVSGGAVCALNAGARSMVLPEGEVLLASGELVDGKLPPNTASWLV